MKLTTDPRQLDMFDVELGRAPIEPFTITQLRRCAEREVNLRKRVYPNRIMTHRLSAKFAARQIALMQAIADHFAMLEAR